MTAPSRAGRYRIEQIIGVGGFASVYLAHDDELRSPVAVKILADNWARQTHIRERFLQEARLLRRADSHRLVQVFDIGTLDDGRPYFVMTYADRGTLEDRMGGAPMPVDSALDVVEEIGRGVAVLHSIGVVHRDLKPSNVLFCARPEGGERVMVADLGIARSADHLSGLTLPAGSPGYQAPEQLRVDGAPDSRADVHGLGALTYHLLTGRVPGRHGERVPPSAARPGVPEPIDDVVMCALHPDRDRRWPDAAAFISALVTARAGHRPALPAAPAPPAGPFQAVPPQPGPPQAVPPQPGPPQAVPPQPGPPQAVPPQGGPPQAGPVAAEEEPRPGSRMRPLLAGGAAVAVAAAGTAVAIMALAGNPPEAGGSAGTSAASGRPASPAASSVASPGASSTASSTASSAASSDAWFRPGADVPERYRPLIVQAGTTCELRGLSPALIAAMLKAESGFDPGLSDPANDEYGIARWTPSVLRHWQPGGYSRPEPRPPLSPELSIPAMGRFMCGLGPRIADVPGDPAINLAALYRSGVEPVRKAGGVPARWREYTQKVAAYLREYSPA
ncbi:soluble lytic murein transglycosylase-like protein [Thermocatellispora tengchongensis]|uniref:non-specific serine/threonine protein kinase n=1 Tax=Thermocatellispora tengchongensis TaxID=1073253 RepID=A0A840PEG3_9ACTN|nr:protein kinase [Thermocatellispora tengchongensis]MBB5136323.1 soluble lytic murein transglycosylase-like protein [Thermocatellispora tengchongensis]